MRQPFKMLLELILVDVLDGSKGARVKLATAIAEQARVGDLLRQCVLECVAQLGKQRRLVDEPASVQSPQHRMQHFLIEAHDVSQQAERGCLSDNGHGLQQLPIASREPVDPSGQYRVH